MTRVTYRQGSFMREIVAEGHAGAGEAGQDIVCAAVSMLMQTLEARVRERPGYYPMIEKREDVAMIRIRCLPDSSEAAMCQETYNTIRAGFRALAAKYPEHVEYSE